MVLGHIPVSDTPLKIIYTFHMPLFFMLSGWLTKPVRPDFSVYVEKKLAH